MLNNWKRRQNAIYVAVRYFENSSRQKAIRPMCSAIAIETERCIVRVCYGNTKPPSRIFYAVYDLFQEVTELPFEEVSIVYGEKAWR
jgi:hypothetical protein